MGDGDGWAVCDLGHRHWGVFGASGLLLYQGDAVLLQHRSRVSIGGGTWGLLGGATHSHEDAVTGALREAGEESSLDPGAVRVHGTITEDHGGWQYTTVIASTPERMSVQPRSFETAGVEWVHADQVTAKKLFPPFGDQWHRLREALYRQTIVVDTANVMGSRPDGWWRDRAGAAARIRDALVPLATLPGTAGDGAARSETGGISDVPGAVVDVTLPEIVMVVEGAARAMDAAVPDGVRLRVVAAPGSGDDTIAEQAAPLATDERRLVVTADRELRARCEAVGAAVTGPRWLLNHMP